MSLVLPKYARVADGMVLMPNTNLALTPDLPAGHIRLPEQIAAYR